MKFLTLPMSGLSLRELPLPRQHLYAIMMLAGFSVASVTLLPSPSELLTDSPVAPIAVNDVELSTASEDVSSDTEYLNIPDHELVGNADTVDGAEDADPNAGLEPQWMDYTVKTDDNLSFIFDTLNLPAKTLHQLLQVDIQNSLIRLKPGQKLAFLLNDQNMLQRLVIPVSLDSQVVFERKDDTYVSRLEALSDQAVAEEQVSPVKDNKVADTQPVVTTSRLLKGTITSAFGTNARSAGLTANQVVQVTRLFQGRIDFRRDLRKGDTFRILLDKPAAAGHPNRDAKVVAVELTSRGRDYSAYRHTDNQFYDDDGSSFVGGTFLRYPIPSVRRVSSSFSPSRRNPVTGRVMPHNGTDFAVRVGTPVVATGDGVVLKATSHSAAGRYIVIRHNGKYSTTYMHLSKLLVKPGQKVKQGQKIALSGNTGRSTGPHLHYEFRVNNRPVNPMRVDLPVNHPMEGRERRQFLAKVKDYQRQLNG